MKRIFTVALLMGFALPSYGLFYVRIKPEDLHAGPAARVEVAA